MAGHLPGGMKALAMPDPAAPEDHFKRITDQAAD